jgi:hypothetical protein
MQLKDLNSEVIWLLEEEGIYTRRFFCRGITQVEPLHPPTPVTNVVSWDNLAMKAGTLLPEKLLLQQQEYFFLRKLIYGRKNASNFIDNSKNVYSSETSVTRVKYTFLSNFISKCKNDFSSESLCKKGNYMPTKEWMYINNIGEP